MENPVMNDLEFYSKFAKPLIINLPEVKDRILASKWVQKIQNADTGTEALRTNYLKLLLFALQRQKLVGIFADDADTYEKLDPFPDEYDLNDMAKDLIEKEQTERIRRIRTQLRGQQGDWPPYTTDCSADYKEYVAAQDIPGFGVHCYYAISKDPVYKWSKAEKGIFPKTAKSAVDTSGPSGLGHDAFSDSCVCPPKEDPSGEASECKARAHEKEQQDQTKDVKKKRPKRLGKSPPTSPLGVVVPPTEERPPPLWGSNLMEVRDQPIKEASPVAGPSTAVTPSPRHLHPPTVEDVGDSDSDIDAVKHAIEDFKRGAITPSKKSRTPSKATPKQAAEGQDVEAPQEEGGDVEPPAKIQQDEEEDDLFSDLKAAMRQAEIGEDEFLLDYFRKRLKEAETKQELAAVTEQIKHSSPASAGIPVTTPRPSVSPRRVSGGIEQLLQDDNAEDTDAPAPSKEDRKDVAHHLQPPTRAPRTFSPSPMKDLNLSRIYEQAYNLDDYDLRHFLQDSSAPQLGDSSFPSSLDNLDLSHMTPGQQDEYKRTLMDQLKTPPPPQEQEEQAPQDSAPPAPIVKGSPAAAPVLAEFVNVMEKSRKKEQTKLPRKGIPTRKGGIPQPAQKSTTTSRIPSRSGAGPAAGKSGIKPPSTGPRAQQATTTAKAAPAQPPTAQPPRRGPPSPIVTPPIFSTDPAVRKAAEGMVYPEVPMDDVQWIHGPDYFAGVTEFEPYDPRQMDIEDVFGIQPAGLADQEFFELQGEPEIFGEVEQVDALDVSPMKIQMPFSPTKNLEYPQHTDVDECVCPEDDITALTTTSPFDMLSEIAAPEFSQSPTSPQRQASPPPKAPSPVPGPSWRVTPSPPAQQQRAPSSPQPGPSRRVTPPPTTSSHRTITPPPRGQYRVPIGPMTRPGGWVSPEVTPPKTLLDTTPPAQMMPPMSPTGPKTVPGWRTPSRLRPIPPREYSTDSSLSIASPCGVCSPLLDYSLGSYSGDISLRSIPEGESFHDSAGSQQQEPHFESHYSGEMVDDFEHEDLVSPYSFYAEDDIPHMYSDPLAVDISSQFLDESMPSYEEPGMEHIDIDVEELRQQQLPSYLRKKKPVEQDIAEVGHVQQHYQPQPMRKQKRDKAKLKKPHHPELTPQEERYINWAFIDDKETGQLVKRMSRIVADIEQDIPDPHHVVPTTPELPQAEGDVWLGDEMLPEADLPRSPGPSRIPGIRPPSGLRPPGSVQAISGPRPPCAGRPSQIRPPGSSAQSSRLKPPGAERPPTTPSGLRPPGFSGLRPPGTSGLRPPGASGLRPPGATGLRPPGASGLRPPGTSGLRPPSRLRPPGSIAPPCAPCEGAPATPSGIRPPGTERTIRPPGARPAISGLTQPGRSGLIPPAGAPFRSSGIPTPRATATSGIPTPGARRALRQPGLRPPAPSCACPEEAPPRPREPTPSPPWHISPSGEGLMDDTEMAEFYRQSNRWDTIESQASKVARLAALRGEEYHTLNANRPRTEHLGSPELRQIEQLCRQALGPTPPPPSPYQPYVETPTVQQPDREGRQRRGGKRTSRLPPGARRRRLDDEYLYVEEDPVIERVMQSHPDLPPLPPEDSHPHSPDILAGSPPGPGLMDEPVPVDLPSPMAPPVELPGWQTPKRLRKQEPKRESPKIPPPLPNWMFQGGNVESLGDIAPPCGICSPGEDIHSPPPRTPSPQMPMPEEEQHHAWMATSEEGIEYLSDMEAPCDICSDGSRTPSPRRLPLPQVGPQHPPRPVQSKREYKEARTKIDVPSPPPLTPIMFDDSPGELYTPPSGTEYRTPKQTAAGIFEQYGLGESPSRTPIGPRLISPDRREMFQKIDEAEGRAGIKRQADRSRYIPPLHAIPEIPPPPPKPPTPAPARFPPRDQFGLPLLKQAKVKTPPLQVKRVERRPLKVQHQHPDQYRSPSPCQPCALGPLDEQIPDHLPDPLRPRPNIPGWTTPPRLKPKQLTPRKVQWPPLPRYELGTIPPTPPSVGSREASFYTPDIPEFTTPPSVGYREPSYHTPSLDVYSPPPCSPCFDGYSPQDSFHLSPSPSPMGSSGASSYFSPPMEDLYAGEVAGPVLHVSPIGDEFGLIPYRSPEAPPRRRSPTPPPPAPKTPVSRTPRPPSLSTAQHPPRRSPISPTSRVLEQYLAGEPLHIDEVQVSPIPDIPPPHVEYYKSPLRPLEVPINVGAGGFLGEESFQYQSPCTPCSSPSTPHLSPQWNQLASATVHQRISPDHMMDLVPPSPPYMSSGDSGSGFASPTPHMDRLDYSMMPMVDSPPQLTPQTPPPRQRPPPARDLLNTSFLVQGLPSPMSPRRAEAHQQYRTPPVHSPPVLDISNPLDLSSPELSPVRPQTQQQFEDVRTPAFGSPLGQISPPPAPRRPRVRHRSPEISTRQQPHPRNIDIPAPSAHQRRSPPLAADRTPSPQQMGMRTSPAVGIDAPGPCGICGGERVETHLSKTRKFISVMPPPPPSDLSPIYSPSPMSDRSFDGMPPEEAGFKWMDR